MPLDYTIKAGGITRPKPTKYKKHAFGLEMEQNEKDGHFYMTKVDGLMKQFTDFQVGDRLYKFQNKDASEWTIEEIRETIQDALTIRIQAKHFNSSRKQKSKGFANKSSYLGSRRKEASRNKSESSKIKQFLDDIIDDGTDTFSKEEESEHTATTVPLGNDSSHSLSWMNDSTASFANDDQNTLEEVRAASEKAEEEEHDGEKNLEEDLDVVEEEIDDDDDQKDLEEDLDVVEEEEEEDGDQKDLEEDPVVPEKEEQKQNEYPRSVWNSGTEGQDQIDDDDGNDDNEEELWKKKSRAFKAGAVAAATVDESKTKGRTWVSRFPVSDKSWMLKQGNFNIMDSDSKDVQKVSLKEADVKDKKIRTQVLLDTKPGVKHLAKQYDALAKKSQVAAKSA